MFATTSKLTSQTHFDKEFVFPSKFNRHRQTLVINKNSTETLFQFKQQVHIASISGLGLLITTDNPMNAARYQYHVLTENVILPENMYFNIIALANICHINLTPFGPAKPNLFPTYKEIVNPQVQPLFVINQMYTMTSTELMAGDDLKLTTSEDYRLIIVDQNQIDIKINDQTEVLTENTCMIVGPKSSYEIQCNQLHPARMLTIYFSVENLPHHFLQEPLQLSQRVLRHLMEFVELVDLSQLSTKMENLFSDKIINHFQGFLIDLLDANAAENPDALNNKLPSTSMRMNQDDQLFQDIIQYIDQNIEGDVKVSELSDKFDISRSTIQNLFQTYLEQTPKQYINSLRLNRSKQLIRESTLSLTEIAEKLNFGTIQYFSRAFKNEFGMTPSAYSKSIIP